MGARFPDLKELGPVAAHEWRTLRSLNLAYVDLRHEWEAACLKTDGLRVKLDVVEEYATPDLRYQHHLAALGELYDSADVYERQASALTWRSASAAVVLGMTVLDRLVCDRPPLAESLVEKLSTHEPTLGTLREVCDAPYERLIAARADDHYGTEAKAREELLGLLRGAAYNLEHIEIGGRRLNALEIDDCQLSVTSPALQDPLWDDLLRPMLTLAESVPYAIARWLDRGSVSDAQRGD
ncbi:hypothetical protein AB0919_23260 [Streptomyces sp. NPDC046994]|uniref:hypothetical protein n=1 Tax=Streptomyces sp. NPDC046994 TaxID=3155735 RepID=UPI00345484DC